MKATLSFNEIRDIISKKTNNKVQLDFSYVNNSTIKVSYKPVAFLPAVGINVRILVSVRLSIYYHALINSSILII